MYHLATSRVCVVDGYIVPVSILSHNDRLFVVQMWHALGAIKQFGYQSLGRPGGRGVDVARTMRMHRNYDAVLCGGPGAVPAFSSAFDVDPGIVLPLGLPAVDALRHAAAEHSAGAPPSEAVTHLRERYPRLADRSKTVVLYAPTFRKNGEIAYQDIVRALGPERFTLVIKPHDLEEADVSGEHVVDASGIAVVDLLTECDIVVTDYSAVAFEAFAIERPVYFWVFDIEQYRSAQGLNIDPLEVLPDVSSTSISDIAAWIVAGAYPADAVAAFARDHVPPRGRQCTRDIAELVLSHVR
jgi:CDP-ribitol ribitolphosphotransferase